MCGLLLSLWRSIRITVIALCTAESAADMTVCIDEVTDDGMYDVAADVVADVTDDDLGSELAKLLA